MATSVEARRFVKAALQARAAMARMGDRFRLVSEAAAELDRVLTAPVRPVYGAVETQDPANQWLANHRARRRLALDRVQAGNLARWYVRGGLDPAYADPRDRDAMVRELARSGGYQWADLAASFLRGWVEHRDGAIEPGSAWEEDPDGCPAHPYRPHETVRYLDGWAPWVHYRQRYALGIDQVRDPYACWELQW